MKFNPVRYAENVVTGKGYKRGQLHILSCERFLKDWENQKDKGWIYDSKAAERYYRFSKLCYHWKSATFAGKIIDFVDWQKFMYGNLHGWKMAETGLIRFRQSYHQIAKKNYKTTGAAVDAIFHLCKSDEAGAQVWTGSNREEQARIIVNDAGQIIQASKHLKNRFKIHWYGDKATSISYKPLKARMEPLSKDANRQDGFHPSRGYIDEYHEARTTAVRNNIRSGSGGRLNFQMLIITTAGYRTSGPCWDLRTTAIEILKGIKTDDRFFILIDELDEKDDWNDRSNWIKANPRINDDPMFLTEFLDPEYKTAINEGGQSVVDFRTKNLNQFLNVAEVWLTDEIFQSCNFYSVTLADFKQREVWVGLDLASGIDLNAAAFISPNERTKKLDVFWMYWHTESRAKQNRDDVDYVKWVEEGYIKTTPGNIIDHNVVAEDIIKFLDILDVKAIDYDTKVAHHGVIQNIVQSGFENVRPLSQGTASLGEPINEMEKRFHGGTINHGGNPVSRWMSSNCVMFQDTGGFRRPSKKASSSRIDGVAALVNAIAGYQFDIANPDDQNSQIFV